MKYVKIDTENKKIKIDFNSVFERDDLNNETEFKLEKRSYYKSIKMIAEEIDNCIVDSNSSYTLHLLGIVKAIESKKITTMDQLLENVRILLSDKPLLEYIKNLVENSYTIDIEGTKEENKNLNLQVTNEMNKKYLQACITLRLLIPIISYLKYLESNKDLNKLIFNLNTEVLLFFNNGDNEILKKIHNIVESRVKVTKYSDNVIWKYLKNERKNMLTVISDYYQYLIINIIVKVENNRSFVLFIHSIIRGKLNYMFTYDYKNNYKVLNYENTEDSLSDIEKIELNITRSDKTIGYLNEMSIRKEIHSIMIENDTDDIQEFVNDLEEINPIQILFLEVFYSKKIYLTKDEETLKILLYGMCVKLDEMDLSTMAMALSCRETTIIKVTNKKNIITKVSSSKKYNLLLNKYQVIFDLLTENNFIYSLIFGIKSRRYFDYDEDEKFEVSLDGVEEEVLDFLLKY